MSLAIETEKLTKAYGRKARGIEDLDLAVEEGEVFGFLGPNGAGKTTTVRTLLGFLRPTGGRGQVFGLDIRKESVQIRARVGNLPGEFALEDKMTGEGLLKYFARLRGVKDLDYAHEISERLGAELHRPMRRLSRGNKQKIGLVQAMFHRPPLLMLDEPTGGLDPLVQEEFLHIIEEVKAEGRTVFFSSHNLAEVERVSDRVRIIRGGGLVAVETTETLIDKAFRHIVLTFAEDVDSKPFEALSGVKDLRAVGNRLAFTLYDNLTRWSNWWPATSSSTWSTSGPASKTSSSPTTSGRMEKHDEHGCGTGKANRKNGAAGNPLRAPLAHGQDAAEECAHLGGCARALQRGDGSLVHGHRGERRAAAQPAHGGLPEGYARGVRHHRPRRSRQLPALPVLRPRAPCPLLLPDPSACERHCGSRRARHHRRPARQPPPALATRRRQLPRHRPLATRDLRPRRPPHPGTAVLVDVNLSLRE